MKIILLLSFILCHLATAGQMKPDEISAIEKELNIIQLKQAEIDQKLQQLSVISNENRNAIQVLAQSNETLCGNLDSLQNICTGIEKAQAEDRVSVNGKIQQTNATVASNQSSIETRLLWGGAIAVIVLLVLLIIAFYLSKRIQKESSSINEVRKAQEALQVAQIKMQEESIKLDNKLIDLFEKQIHAKQGKLTNSQADHSLALKVADEIVRIEMNLSHMDSSIKGYKQLAKAVQRIKDNFNANGYEIVDMLGKPYVAGMKAAVTFVVDEKLEHGQQIITKIIKPQINYEQQMIQAAQIEVSQPE